MGSALRVHKCVSQDTRRITGKNRIFLELLAGFQKFSKYFEKLGNRRFFTVLDRFLDRFQPFPRLVGAF